jgi:hypothetical protein
MKKVLLLAVIALAGLSASAQISKKLNFGGLGTGLYLGYELPLGASPITIVPQVNTDYEFNRFIIGAKGNFYFNNIFGLNSSWDVYAGANAGWRLDNKNDNDSGFDIGAQIGGRWYWNDKWGLNAEFGGGTSVLGGLGVTMNM